jgi:uncharacterized membrane protein
LIEDRDFGARQVLGHEDAVASRPRGVILIALLRRFDREDPIAHAIASAKSVAVNRPSSIEDMPPAAVGRHAKGAPGGEPGHFHFHALLYPNKSLSADGFRRVLFLVILVNAINAVIYFTVGAWPVAFFCGLDILLVWFAFQLSYRSLDKHEEVMLTDDALWVSRVLPSGHETRWKLNPAFVKVRIDRPVLHETQLRLSERGRTLVLASFLSPKERDDFARALDTALCRLRAA